MPFIHNPSASPKGILKGDPKKKRPQPTSVPFEPWDTKSWLVPTLDGDHEVRRRIKTVLWALGWCGLPGDVAVVVAGYSLTPVVRLSAKSETVDNDKVEVQRGKLLW